ncbi:hypothetical protein GCK72_000566 [Caenorhabditis remanei]|uniref:Uncharacterized protein n=1 Tax=Caenorhabditis remanei TaxID=31234 RepID=A0A6A5HR72_CAERE|nr:hypothetical protein GCK72_000566 [Caenorhabditis remanei]KAF1768753.1 hypothetical protein GCK72_000566 [Caenorhabditis remanei]
MVSNGSRKKTGSRPLWIVKINKRMSMSKFKTEAKWITAENLSWVLKGEPTDNVYQVTVETMENCETDECMQKMWVPEEFVKATGEMLERFDEEEEEEIENTLDTSIMHELLGTSPESIDNEYKQVCEEETFDPYATAESDNGEVFDDVPTATTGSDVNA